MNPVSSRPSTHADVNRSHSIIITTTEKHLVRVLARTDQRRLLSTYLAKWRAYLCERQLDVHLHRCAALLKHHTRRHVYSRYFMRWLANTQQRASEEARSLRIVAKDVPLRTKQEMLALVSAYFGKWRLCVRQHRQRSTTNVLLLQQSVDERHLRQAWGCWLRGTQQRREREAAVQLAASTKDATEWRSRCDGLVDDHAKLEHTLATTQEELREACQRTEDLRAELEELKRSSSGHIHQLSAELSQVRAEHHDCAEELADVRAAAEKECQHLRQQLSQSSAAMERASAHHVHLLHLATSAALGLQRGNNANVDAQDEDQWQHEHQAAGDVLVQQIEGSHVDDVVVGVGAEHPGRSLWLACGNTATTLRALRIKLRQKEQSLEAMRTAMMEAIQQLGGGGDGLGETAGVGRRTSLLPDQLTRLSQQLICVAHDVATSLQAEDGDASSVAMTHGASTRSAASTTIAGMKERAAAAKRRLEQIEDERDGAIHAVEEMIARLTHPLLVVEPHENDDAQHQRQPLHDGGKLAELQHLVDDVCSYTRHIATSLTPTQQADLANSATSDVSLVDVLAYVVGCKDQQSIQYEEQCHQQRAALIFSAQVLYRCVEQLRKVADADHRNTRAERAMKDGGFTICRYILDHCAALTEKERQSAMDYISRERVPQWSSTTTSEVVVEEEPVSTMAMMGVLFGHINLAIDAKANREEQVQQQQDELRACAQKHQQADDLVQEAAQELSRWWGAEPRELHSDADGGLFRQRMANTSSAASLVEEAREVAAALRTLKCIAENTDLSQLRKQPRLGRGVGSTPTKKHATPPPPCITTLPALVQAVQLMHDTFKEIREMAEDGVAALLGAPTSSTDNSFSHSLSSRCGTAAAAASGSGGAVKMMMEEPVMERLNALCISTGESLEELKQMVGMAPEMAAPLHDLLPSVKERVQELAETQKNSDALLAYLDEAMCCPSSSPDLHSSYSSITGKTLRPKPKPMPALQTTEEAQAYLQRQGMKKARSADSLAHPHSSTLIGKNAAWERITDVHDLHLACRMVAHTLDGSFAEGDQLPTYGEGLLASILHHVNHIKQVLPSVQLMMKQCIPDVGNPPQPQQRDGRAHDVGSMLELLVATINAMRLRDRTQQKESIELKEQMAAADADVQAMVKHVEERDVMMDLARKENDAERVKMKSERDALRAELQQCQEALDEHLLAEEAAGQEIQKLHEKIQRELGDYDGLSSRVAELQHHENQLVRGTSTLLAALPQDDVLHRLSPAEYELKVAEQLHHGEESLLTFIHKNIARMRSLMQQHTTNMLQEVHHLRRELQQLREDSGLSTWKMHLLPFFTSLLSSAEEEQLMLQHENNMLRPRALEREALRVENDAMQRHCAALEERLAQVKPSVLGLEAEVAHLQRGMLELQQRAKEDAARGPYTNTEEQLCRCCSLQYLDAEQRIVAGATQLTMEAITSMCGGPDITHAAAKVGQTSLHLFHEVDDALRDMEGSLRELELGGAPLSMLPMHAHFMAVLEQQRLRLGKLRGDADALAQHVPAMLRIRYTS